MRTSNNYKPILINRRAIYDYDITETMIAGMVLSGAEVKSIRTGLANLKGSFANFSNGELWANNIHISPYPRATYDKTYDPTRARKLLVSKSQLDKLAVHKQNGKQIAVLSLGVSGKYLKLEIGIGTSKKKHDKRHQIKAKMQTREAQQSTFGRKKT